MPKEKESGRRKKRQPIPLSTDRLYTSREIADHTHSALIDCFRVCYSDFRVSLKRTYPDLPLIPRVRLDKEVEDLLKSFRPGAVHVPLVKVKRRIDGDEGLIASEIVFSGEPCLRIQSCLPVDADSERPYIEILSSERNILVHFNAEVDENSDQLVFVPAIANIARALFPEPLERKILKNLKLNSVTKYLSSPIRFRQITDHCCSPTREERDGKGWPLWRLQEIPAVEVYLLSATAKVDPLPRFSRRAG